MFNKILEILWNIFQGSLPWVCFFLVFRHRVRFWDYFGDRFGDDRDKFDKFRK